MEQRRNSPRKLSSLAKVAMGLQVFLLRRNWMGAMGDQVMLITTRGRKTGKSRVTPIGYLQDGNRLIALNNGGASNWYKNMLTDPVVTLEIKGRRVRAQGAPVHDPEERHRLFELYRRERSSNFEVYFGVPPDAPQEALERALASRQFVAFDPLPGRHLLQ